MLNLNSLAASPCVISFFLVFFNATSRSLSTWVISSCPSCIPKAWGCQDDISTLLKDDILILLPQYHVVFVPKRRRKAIFGQARRQLGAIFHALAGQKECQIIEGHLMPDHVHICIANPPKHPVASVIGFLKGKSAIAIARLSGKERNFTG